MINNQPVGGIILGRSSATLQGLHIDPGVIDSDSTGELFILARTNFPPLTVPKGEKIAQFIPLASIVQFSLYELPKRQGQIGSTGEITMLSLNLSERPRRCCQILWRGHVLSLSKALLDTGADSCIMDSKLYPNSWPTISINNAITGIGGVRLARQTPILTVLLEGKRASAPFSLTPLPDEVDCILGRDVLAQMGFKLTDSPLV